MIVHDNDEYDRLNRKNPGRHDMLDNNENHFVLSLFYCEAPIPLLGVSCTHDLLGKV